MIKMIATMFEIVRKIIQTFGRY